MSKPSKTKRLILPTLVIFVFSTLLWLMWPVHSLFPDTYSRLVFDNQNQLMRVTLAKDEQYRFPYKKDDLPEKYKKALIFYEDKRFYYHPGVDPFAMLHAVWQNIQSGEILRGGSTITMQLVRLSKPRERTYLNKLVECFSALRYSFHFSKNEILGEYAAHVPMGGNIVGIETASNYYFGKSLTEITWAEAALLVVLPNSPSRINLARSRDILLKKRNALLKRLHDNNYLDSTTYHLAIDEPLISPENKLPFKAPHFTNYLLKTQPELSVLHSTLDPGVQTLAEQISAVHRQNLSNMGIQNLSLLIAETKSGKVRAYCGSHSFYDSVYSGQIDGVQAHRSTGSLLKPFLVAKILDRGPYTMHSMIRDVPTFYGTFVPQNASRKFSGLASLETILINSLNVPSVRMLNYYGTVDFYHFLKEAGFQALFRRPEEYGLSIILGGAEASLAELTQLYLALGQFGSECRLKYLENTTPYLYDDRKVSLFSAGSAWLVINALNKLSRPGLEYYWNYFDNHLPVAWKTGTSYGQKDGWAIGVNQQWTIGVWTGNFNGEGNAALTGSRCAAPILFDLFNSLDYTEEDVWFSEPEYDLQEIECCMESGYPANPLCPKTFTAKKPLVSHMPGVCPYHKRYLVDKFSGKSVCSLCWSHADMEWQTRYIVPASVRHILTHQGYDMDIIPGHFELCSSSEDQNRLEITYPVDGIKILIPRDLDGNFENIVFAARHHQPASNLFWYLNGNLVGNTRGDHSLSLKLDKGIFRLTVQDEEGFSKTVKFSAFKNES